MNPSMPSPTLFMLFSIALMAIFHPIYAQVNTPCTSSMISSFTPCMNFVTNSSGNGTTPTSDCCNALRSLTNGGMGCLCLIVNGNVPLQIPINRTLAISLPSSCNMPGVPLQCQALGAPVPAPGPALFGPTLAPTPQASFVPTTTSPALSPESDIGPTVDAEAPTATNPSRPVLTPSAAKISHSLSPSLMLLALGCAIFKLY